jgi:hypothetical protein
MASATHTLFGHLDDPVHMALFYVWRRHSGWRPMPSETDIDFEDLAPILSHVGLVDALDDGQRFRYRHIGPWSSSLLSSDAGEEDIDPGSGAPHLTWLHDLYADVVHRQAPVYAECVYKAENTRRIWTMRLVLPLAGDRGDVESLLYSVSFAPCLARSARIGRIIDVFEAKRVVFQPAAGRDFAPEQAFEALEL